MLMRFWRMRQDGPMPPETGHQVVHTRQVRPHRQHPAQGSVLSCDSTFRPNWMQGQQNEQRPGWYAKEEMTSSRVSQGLSTPRGYWGEEVQMSQSEQQSHNPDSKSAP